MRRHAAALGLLLATGCAYFNGIYNARQAEKRGDRLSRSGRLALAAAVYESTAVKAESVLAHHADSKWADDARYLAGRGWALAGACDRARPHLDAVLATSTLDARRRDRATVALGICRTRAGEHAAALALLAPLTRADDRALSRTASLWAGRAALALGDRDEALGYLERVGDATRDWELGEFLLDRGELAAAESALVRRAAAGDGDARLDSAVARFWRAGDRAAAERLVRAAERSRLSPSRRGWLHIALADRWDAAGDDSAALEHLASARAAARDTLVAREVAARMLAIELRSLATPAEVDAAVAAGRRKARGTAIMQRLEDNLLLFQLLQQRNDQSGAGLFLAAEVARDSLRAPALALSLFRDLPASAPASPFAPKALLAASAIAPDSASAFRARLDGAYAASPYAALVDGGGAEAAERVRVLDARLGELWSTVTKVWADSLKTLHEVPTSAAPLAPARTLP